MSINISFSDYSPPEITENSGQKQEIVASFFFDGTLNNLRNSYIRKEKEKKKLDKPYDKIAVADDPWGWDKDSYLNDYSNVARKYQVCKEVNKFYIEGIGTEDGETDTVRGYTTGTGSTGIRAKIRKGCEKLSEKVRNDVTLDLIIDVFGFSRGAAAARAFVHELTRQKYSANVIYTDFGEIYEDLDGYQVNEKDLPARGHLGMLLKQKNVTINLFKIRFVGLYDTVSSYGLNFEDDTTDKVDISEINLSSISHGSVKRVVQIAAGHEWRKNFNLTNIKSCGSRGLELTFPGAHADIGGCYESAEEIQMHYIKPLASDMKYIGVYGNTKPEFEERKEFYKKDLIGAGWYKSDEITFEFVTGAYTLAYKGKRFVYKQYSYIPLYFMCEYSMETGTKINFSSLKNEFKIPQTAGSSQHILAYVHEKLKEYAKNAESGEEKSYKSFLDFINEKILINSYIHWSATNKLGHSPRINNVRKIVNG